MSKTCSVREDSSVGWRVQVPHLRVHFAFAHVLLGTCICCQRCKNRCDCMLDVETNYAHRLPLQVLDLGLDH